MQFELQIQTLFFVQHFLFNLLYYIILMGEQTKLISLAFIIIVLPTSYLPMYYNISDRI